MIDPNRALSRAGRLYRQGKYSDVIHLLEPQVFLFRDESRFYYLLGMACFHAQDLGGAETYLARAADLTPEEVEIRLSLAALRARKGEVGRAMREWLAVLESDPKNRIAKSGLDLVRKSETESAVQRVFHGREISRYLPKRQRSIKRSISLLSLLVVALLGSWLVVFLIDREGNEEFRAGGELLVLEPEMSADLIDYAGTFRYTLTQDEIEQQLEQLREQFHDERDNLARRSANRLLLSNASTEIKRRVSLLTDYFQQPDLLSLRDNFTYPEVASQPWIYEGTHVIWRGRVTNLQISEQVIAFDFLVGFEEGQVLEGVVATQFFFAVEIAAGTNVELLGRVVTLEDGAIALRGEALRLLGPGEGES